MSFVESALRSANVEALDARGLMPVVQAREILSATRVVDRDTLDPVWAAMLSLTTPEELVQWTRHLEWQMPVRGMDNIALVERYGAGALAWIMTRVHSGVLLNHPWCVVPSLLALADPGALDLMLSIRGAILDGGSMQFWQFTPGSTDHDPAQLERNALDLVIEWARRHPDIAQQALEARAAHPRAAAALREIAARSELSVERILATLDASWRAEVGTWPWFNMGVDGRCEYYGLRLIAVRSRTGNGWGIVLERLNGCDGYSFELSRYSYGPGTTNTNEFENHHSLEMAIRVLADPNADEEDDDSDDEEEDADDADEMAAESDEEDEEDEDEDEEEDDDEEEEEEVSDDEEDEDEEDEDEDDEDEDEDEEDEEPEVKAAAAEDDWAVERYGEDRPPFTGMTARGPDGDLFLDESLFAKYDLRPGWATESGGNMDGTLVIRAYLEEYPHTSLWPAPEEALAAAGVPDGEILLVSTSFEHASGALGEDVPAQKWHVVPSESATYRSLAEAIVARDPSRFIPGASNLDWRLHATEHEDYYEPPWRAHRVRTKDGYLGAALQDAAIQCDARGLMPLAEARAVAQHTKSLARGNGRYVGKTWVWDLDLTWAALLSLEDATEAAAWMRSLEIVDPPRDAATNTALVERYGDGALAIVAARSDKTGVIQGSPLLRATLLGLETSKAFAFVWSLRGWAEPPADADDEPVAPNAQAKALLDTWVEKHSEVAAVELARRVANRDRVASTYLQTWAAPRVRRVYRWLAPVLGDAEARALLAGVGLSCDLEPVQILAVLDTAATTDGAWPPIRTDAGPSRELHLMRLIAARARGSENWIIVIERFEGYTFHNCRVDRYVYGENEANGLREDLRVSIIPQELPQLPGREQDMVLVESPDYWTKIDNAPAAIAQIRAVVWADPGRFFVSPEALLAQLGLSHPAFVIVTMQFEHTIGDNAPSTLVSYRSLADAIVAGDPARFTPGTPNAWWGPHAKTVAQHEAEAAAAEAAEAAESEEDEDDNEDDDEDSDDAEDEDDDDDEDDDE